MEDAGRCSPPSGLRNCKSRRGGAGSRGAFSCSQPALSGSHCSKQGREQDGSEGEGVAAWWGWAEGSEVSSLLASVFSNKERVQLFPSRGEETGQAMRSEMPWR